LRDDYIERYNSFYSLDPASIGIQMQWLFASGNSFSIGIYYR
jgi:hypothetical protein